MRFSRYIFSFLLALCGAILAQKLNLPIPWLLGSLFVTALLKINNVPIDCPHLARHIGLSVIGVSLGLYFTPEMIQLILESWAVLLLGLIFSLILGTTSALILYKWGQVDFKTAWFASAIGGANEMSNLAEQYNAKVDKVASAHTLRVLLVVVTIPFLYQFMGWHGEDHSYLTHSSNFIFLNFIALSVLCLTSSLLFKKFNLPNPWTFGPLLVAIVLTANNIHLSSIPPSILHLGQILLGWSLGNKFRPDFFQTAPRYMTVVALTNIMTIVLAFLVANIIVFFFDISLPTLFLGLAPGGVAEMTLTAKVLHLGVPLVTAFHVVRMIGVMSSVGVLYQLISKNLNTPSKGQ